MAAGRTASDGALGGGIRLHLPEFDEPPPDPLVLLEGWLAAAEELGVREPRAMALATADAAGAPSSRTVTLKDATGEGIRFSSHSGSRKGRDLAANPQASVTLYWRETLQQVTLSGRVAALEPADSDALFDERPAAARAATVVSRQGEPLNDEAALREAARVLLAADEALRRPAGWQGYLLVPDRVEFWHGRTDRLHRRLDYRRSAVGWTSGRLQP